MIKSSGCSTGHLTLVPRVLRGYLCRGYLCRGYLYRADTSAAGTFAAGCRSCLLVVEELHLPDHLWADWHNVLVVMSHGSRFIHGWQMTRVPRAASACTTPELQGSPTSYGPLGNPSPVGIVYQKRTSDARVFSFSPRPTSPWRL